ncbi:hypothetical protein [Mesorhizobium sp. WSM3626]|uniref:trypsin-like serine peptidase n=1 Tax=Mesorhizobium sp. WSM3626 TaxID=1040987 RepID=UPI0012EC3A4D|nr:hypothetical protein [Mesorhizobium sp. WSM3626]
MGRLGTATKGDYLIGTASELGLVVDDRLRSDYYSYLTRAQAEYDQWLSRPDVADADITGPPELDKLPSALRSDIISYPRRERGAICSIAVKALRYALRKENDNLSLGMLLRANYRASCLTSLYNAGADAIFDRLVFFIDGDKIACAGIVIKRNLVLTARHCFAPGERSWMTRFLITGIHPPPLRVSDVPGRKAIVLANVGLEYNVRPVQTPFNRNLNGYDPITERDVDYLLVELIGYAGSPNLLRSGKPRVGSKILIPAFLGEVARLYGESSSAEAAHSSLRGDDSPLCSVLAVIGSCVVHTCQTDGGYSGTPILQKDENEYAVVGIHTGNFGPAAEPACGFTRGKYFSNYGVVFDERQLDDALK